MVVAADPQRDVLRGDLERVLRQRNALLKQARGRLTPEIAATLEVWDAKLDEAGTALAVARTELVARLAPVLAESYVALAGQGRAATMRYEPDWFRVGLGAALLDARADDVRRGVTTVGPHRDEVELALAGEPARTHASQGEQRTLALALRLASHQVVTDETGAAPILLLDDVFSELDASRRGGAAGQPPGRADAADHSRRCARGNRPGPGPSGRARHRRAVIVLRRAPVPAAGPTDAGHYPHAP